MSSRQSLKEMGRLPVCDPPPIMEERSDALIIRHNVVGAENATAMSGATAKLRAKREVSSTSPRSSARGIRSASSLQS